MHSFTFTQLTHVHISESHPWIFRWNMLGRWWFFHNYKWNRRMVGRIRETWSGWSEMNNRCESQNLARVLTAISRNRGCEWCIPQGFDTQRNLARVLTGRSLSISGMRSSGIEPTPLVLTSSDMLLFFASFDFCLSMAENKVNGQKSAFFLFPFFFFFSFWSKVSILFVMTVRRRFVATVKGQKG